MSGLGLGLGGAEYVQIKDLKHGMKNINAVFIVLEVGAPTLTKDAREVRTLRVADASAAVNLSVWDAAGALLQPGDIVRLARGYASLWRNALTLYSGKSGDLQKVGEFCMLFNEQVNMSEPQPALPPVAAAAAAAAANGAQVQPPARVLPPLAPTAPPRAPPSLATPPSGDAKLAHKTYVRGRGIQRANNRR